MQKNAYCFKYLVIISKTIPKNLFILTIILNFSFQFIYSQAFNLFTKALIFIHIQIYL